MSAADSSRIAAALIEIAISGVKPENTVGRASNNVTKIKVSVFGDRYRSVDLRTGIARR